MLVIANSIDCLMIGDDDLVARANLQFIYWTIEFGKTHQRILYRQRINVGQVTGQKMGWRLRNGEVCGFCRLRVRVYYRTLRMERTRHAMGFES